MQRTALAQNDGVIHHVDEDAGEEALGFLEEESVGGSEKEDGGPGERRVVDGIKKQALRRYDRIGLLTRQWDTAAARRLYARVDLICVERLIFMQMLGLSRSQIKQCLNDQSLSFELLPKLQLQREILLEKRRRLN